LAAYPIDPKTGLKKGAVKVLARLDGTVFDDFAVGKDAVSSEDRCEVF
jgi:hypothetical protein